MAEKKIFRVYECYCPCHRLKEIRHATVCCNICNLCGFRIQVGAKAMQLHAEVCEGTPKHYEKPSDQDVSPSA